MNLYGTPLKLVDDAVEDVVVVAPVEAGVVAVVTEATVPEAVDGEVEVDAVAPDVTVLVAVFEEEVAAPMLNVELVAYTSFTLLGSMASSW